MIASGALPADVPPDFGYVTDAAQKQAQERLAILVQNAKHITDTNSGHEIHKEQPQLVIDAIREVVEAVPQRKLAVGALKARTSVYPRSNVAHRWGRGSIACASSTCGSRVSPVCFRWMRPLPTGKAARRRGIDPRQ